METNLTTFIIYYLRERIYARAYCTLVHKYSIDIALVAWMFLQIFFQPISLAIDNCAHSNKIVLRREKNGSDCIVCELIVYFDAYVDLRSNGAQNLHNLNNAADGDDDDK